MFQTLRVDLVGVPQQSGEPADLPAVHATAEEPLWTGPVCVLVLLGVPDFERANHHLAEQNEHFGQLHLNQQPVVEPVLRRQLETTP